jgi:acyl carrier protein
VTGPTRLELRTAPLSYAQERLWFIDAAAPGSVTYNVPLLLRWTGPIDLPALRLALAAVTARHEVLRTTYRLADGKPVQVVARPGPVEVAVAAAAGWAEARAQAAALARVPFRLAAEPPLRVTVWPGLPGGDAMLLTIHHIAVDGWSLAVLFADLAGAYEAALRGERPSLPPLPVQYADYAVWDRDAGAGERAGELLADRVAQLRAVPAGLALAGRCPATRTEGDRPGDQHEFDVPAALWAGVLALAGRLRVTPFVVVFAAFQEVLRRWSGRSEFLVGVLAADRPHPALEELVGFFVNTVPQRCRVDPERTFAQLCLGVRAEAYRCLSYQRLPFDRVTAAMPETPRGELVTVGFALQNFPTPRYAAPPRWRPAEVLPTGSAKFDLLFLLDESLGRPRGTIEYDPDRYAAAIPVTLAGHVLALLSAAVADPDRPLRRLPLTGRGGYPPCVRPGPTRVWKTTATTVLDLIAERIAAADPDATAVTCDGTDLSWAGLDRWSWAVAGALRERASGRGGHVPVIAARGGALAAGWLGVLRSGAAYVPIGLDTPPQRLAHILAELGATVVVADADGSALLDALGADAAGVERLRLEALRDTPAAPAAPVLSGTDPAMVIYTSGSTGRPKGVLVGHGGLLNTTLWWLDDDGLGPADTVLCTCSTSFDVANFDAIRALAAGARLAFADDWQRRDPRALVELIRGPLGVTSTSMTPSMARAAAAADPGGPTALRVAYLAGEAVSRQLAADCRDRWGAEIRNAYGPTEASCLSTCGPVDPAEESPPIGVPLPNTRGYVLGPYQEELPAGVPGELYVAGAGVGLGYLGRPDLTERAFLPDPYGPAVPADPADPAGLVDPAGPAGPADPAVSVGERMYRTGDRAVLRPDGQLAYLGRVDDQVKILGNRVEPGEVRRLLEEDPRVRAAAVLPAGDPPRLIGYVQLAAGDPPTRDDLVRPLRRWLPTAVLPAQVYAVDELPFTQNDKLDAAALRSLPAVPLADAPAVAVELTGPERQASRLFGEVLGLPTAELPPDADFFTLGGHSLLAVTLLGSAERVAGRPLALRDFLRAPTVAGLGRLLLAAASPSTVDSPVSTVDEWPATSSQQRMWFLDKLADQRLAYLMPTVLELTGEVEVGRLAAALTAVLGRHPALRSRFRLDRRSRRVVYRTDAPAPRVTVTDVAGWAEPRLAEHVSTRCWEPFDLAAGPPVRAELLTAPGRTVLVLTAHHIAQDGWSLGLLLTELASTYRGTAGVSGGTHPGRAPAEPADPSELLGRLRGAPTDIDLPADRPRGDSQTTLAGTVTRRLPAELTRRLRAAADEAGATTFMLTAALLGAALARAGRQRDFLFAFPWAGRDGAADAGTVGMFVNTLILRVDLRGAPSWRALLGRVRDAAMVTYRAADVPLDTLVAELHPDRDLSRPPLTPVYLAATGAVDPGSYGPGVGVRRLPLRPLHIKYELEVVATDQDDRLELAANYLTARFDEASADRLLAAVVAAATDLAADIAAPCLPAPAPAPEETAVPMTRETVLATLADAFAEVGQIDRTLVRPEASLFTDLNVDSMVIAEALIAIEERFGLPVSDEFPDGMSTVADLADHVLAGAPA